MDECFVRLLLVNEGNSKDKTSCNGTSHAAELLCEMCKGTKHVNVDVRLLRSANASSSDEVGGSWTIQVWKKCIFDCTIAAAVHE